MRVKSKRYIRAQQFVCLFIQFPYEVFRKETKANLPHNDLLSGGDILYFLLTGPNKAVFAVAMSHVCCYCFSSNLPLAAHTLTAEYWTGDPPWKGLDAC